MSFVFSSYFLNRRLSDKAQAERETVDIVYKPMIVIIDKNEIYQLSTFLLLIIHVGIIFLSNIPLSTWI